MVLMFGEEMSKQSSIFDRPGSEIYAEKLESKEDIHQKVCVRPSRHILMMSYPF